MVISVICQYFQWFTSTFSDLPGFCDFPWWFYHLPNSSQLWASSFVASHMVKTCCFHGRSWSRLQEALRRTPWGFHRGELAHFKKYGSNDKSKPKSNDFWSWVALPRFCGRPSHVVGIQVSMQQNWLKVVVGAVILFFSLTRTGDCLLHTYGLPIAMYYSYFPRK